MVPPSTRSTPEEDELLITPVPARPIVSDPLLTRIFQERALISADHPIFVRLSLKFFVNFVVSLQNHVFNQEQVGKDETLPVSVYNGIISYPPPTIVPV